MRSKPTPFQVVLLTTTADSKGFPNCFSPNPPFLFYGSNILQCSDFSPSLQSSLLNGKCLKQQQQQLVIMLCFWLYKNLKSDLAFRPSSPTLLARNNCKDHVSLSPSRWNPGVLFDPNISLEDCLIYTYMLPIQPILEMSWLQHVQSKIDLERLMHVCTASKTSYYHSQFLGIAEMLIHWLQLAQILKPTFSATLDLILVYMQLFAPTSSKVNGWLLNLPIKNKNPVVL